MTVLLWEGVTVVLEDMVVELLDVVEFEMLLFETVGLGTICILDGPLVAATLVHSPRTTIQERTIFFGKNIPEGRGTPLCGLTTQKARVWFSRNFVLNGVSNLSLFVVKGQCHKNRFKNFRVQKHILQQQKPTRSGPFS